MRAYSNLIDDTVDARSLIPPHEVRDEAHAAALAESLRKDGWTGRPLLVAQDCNGFHALTGSHRIAAAKRIAGLAVPICLLDQDRLEAYCGEHDMSLDDIIADWDSLHTRLGEIDPRAAALYSLN